MKIDAELKKSSKGSYYIYIPIIEKYVMLEKVEQKLLGYELQKVANKDSINK